MYFFILIIDRLQTSSFSKNLFIWAANIECEYVWTPSLNISRYRSGEDAFEIFLALIIWSSGSSGLSLLRISTRAPFDRDIFSFADKRWRCESLNILTNHKKRIDALILIDKIKCTQLNWSNLILFGSESFFSLLKMTRWTMARCGLRSFVLEEDFYQIIASLDFLTSPFICQ